MADPFLTFGGGEPGLSRAPVNLLDADTAHAFQSRGNWIPNANATTPERMDDPTALFAESAITFDSIAASQASITMGGAGRPLVAASADSVWLAGLWCAEATDAAVEWVSDDGNMISDFVALPAGTWVIAAGGGVSGAAVTQAGITPRFGLDLPLGAGVECRVSAIMIAQGADATFVPSVQIVGVRDDRVKWSQLVWADGGTGAPFGHAQTGATQNTVLGVVSRPDSVMQIFTSNGVDAIGNAVVGGSSIAAVRADGEPIELKVIWDGEDGQMFRRDNGGFVAHGGAYATRLVRNLIPLPVNVGVRYVANSPLPAGAIMYFYELRDGDDGPVVYRMDPADVLAAI